MRIRYPFEFEVTPKEINRGTQWLTLRLKNIGLTTVNNIDVRVYSLDTYGISVLGTAAYIDKLKPREEETKAFQVSAETTTELYASVSGYKDGEFFWTDSPKVKIKVREDVAELESVFALTEPYTSMGKVVKVEATVKGLANSEGLELEFWVEDGLGSSKELQRIEIEKLAAGQEARYTTELTPTQSGYFTIHAYLYDYWRRIGHKTDDLWVQA